MRRPLAAAGLIFILILLFIQLIRPVTLPDHTDIVDKHLTLEGKLARIERRAPAKGERVTYTSSDTGERGTYRSPDTGEQGTYNSSDTGERVIWYICEVRRSGSLLLSKTDDRIMCYMDPEQSDIPLGSEVMIRGRIRIFTEATNPGQFDMRQYYYLQHICLSVTGGELLSYDETDRPFKWRLRDRLSRFARNVGELCDLCFNDRDSAVIRTMLLGDKASLSPDLRSLYSRNGIAHIMSISGLHISMIGSALSALLKKIRLPAPAASVCSVLLMIMYGIMTGSAASAMRAVIMFAISESALIFHRTYDMATALVIAAVLVLIDRPAYLFYSGFQFSFGAISAILLIYPVMEKLFHRIVAGGLSVNIATLPIYLYNYYYFPFLSVLLNLYVIPLMSILLGCALLALAGCAIYIPLGKVMSAPVYIILRIYEWSCRISDMLPAGRFICGRPSVAAVVLYAVITVTVLLLHGKLPRLLIIMGLGIAGIMLTTRLDTGIDVMMIDVGQGDGIYITDNCGTDILIDGGSSDVSDVGIYRISPFLLSQGVSSLDAVFITHMDADHYNGILNMITDTTALHPKIDALYLTSSTHLAGGPAYDELIRAADDAGVPVYSVTYGDRFASGSLSFTCLYPDENCTGADTNNESLVLDMVYNRRYHMLFTGDLGGEGEEALDRILPGYINPDDYLILKCAHHGSKNSTYEPFLDAAGPDLVIISAGKGNSYGHPSPETTGRLDERSIPYFCTIDCGMIDVHMIRGNIELIPYLKNR